MRPMAVSLLPALFVLALLGAALAWALLAASHARAAATRATALAALLAARDRSLGLVVDALRDPALAMLGHAVRLRDLEGAAEAAASVEAHAHRLLALADEAADALALGAAPRTLREERLRLGLLLEQAVERVSAQIRPGRRHWCITPELADLTLRGDARALRGALACALSHAARHSAEDDWVELRLVRTAETVAIVIEDEGSGLGAGDLAPGAAGEGGATRGVGAGLAVARSLLQAHGGDLTVEAAPGIGSRAWLTLPAWRTVGVPTGA